MIDYNIFILVVEDFFLVSLNVTSIIHDGKLCLIGYNFDMHTFSGKKHII